MEYPRSPQRTEKLHIYVTVHMCLYKNILRSVVDMALQYETSVFWYLPHLLVGALVMLSKTETLVVVLSFHQLVHLIVDTF